MFLLIIVITVLTNDRTGVVSLQDGWVNTWAVDWPWCASRFPRLFFLRLTSNIHIAHSFSSSVVCSFVRNSYIRIFIFLKLLSLYGSYLPLLALFLPVHSASSSVCKEHGVLCVNFLVIITPHNSNRVNECRFLFICRRFLHPRFERLLLVSLISSGTYVTPIFFALFLLLI